MLSPKQNKRIKIVISSDLFWSDYAYEKLHDTVLKRQLISFLIEFELFLRSKILNYY